MTVAGGGPNHLPAISANLIFPEGTAVDGTGNLYIAASSQHRVFRVDQTGNIAVAAGNGAQGYGGDKGPAIYAELGDVPAVAIDSAGNLYIADADNERIRKVNTSGVITTVAGNGKTGFYGDGAQATGAELHDPSGVAVDAAGNIYIADYVNNRIRKVDIAGNISTVAGNGSYASSGDGGLATKAGLYGPSGVAVDTVGNLYIVERDGCRIRRVDTGKIITTVAGDGMCGFNGDGGPATGAELFYPWGVAADGSGNLYIADYLSNRIRKVDSLGIITTVAGDGTAGFGGDGGPAVFAELNTPTGVAVDAVGSLYLADLSNDRIRKVGFDGVIDTVAGDGMLGFGGDGYAATDASLYFPLGTAVDSAGDLFIADSDNYRVREVGAGGDIHTFAGDGMPGFCGDGGSASDACLYPFRVAVDAAGNLYIVDSVDNRIRKVSNGVITTVAGNGTAGFCGDNGAATDACLNNPAAVAVDADDTLYIADYGNNRVRKIDPNGVITTVVGIGPAGFSGDGGPAADARLYGPYGIAIAAGNLYIADFGNHRVRMVDGNGVITTVAGNGTVGFSGDGGAATDASLSGPLDVAVDGGGNLYVADYENYRVRMVDSGGIITTIAGNGVLGLSGDGRAPSAAEMSDPFGLTVDTFGNLYITDRSNQRIRCISTVNSGLCADNTPPSITVPADIIAAPDRASGAAVKYPPAIVTDNVDPAPAVSYSKGSNTVFPFGITTVVVTATDSRGNSNTASFTVTVEGADPVPMSCHGLTPTIVGSNNHDLIYGTAGPDVIAGLGGDDTIYGLGGDDIICGGDGNDLIYGGDGNDILDGESGNDRLMGNAGNDALSGGAGDDYLYGYDGDDALDGGDGTDACYGSTGTDTQSNCETVTGVP